LWEHIKIPPFYFSKTIDLIQTVCCRCALLIWFEYVVLRKECVCLFVCLFVCREREKNNENLLELGMVEQWCSWTLCAKRKYWLNRFFSSLLINYNKTFEILKFSHNFDDIWKILPNVSVCVRTIEAKYWKLKLTRKSCLCIFTCFLWVFFSLICDWR
jgi:hypothetical protein